MERRLISGHSPVRADRRLLARRRRRRPRARVGHRAASRRTARRRPRTPTTRRSVCLEIIGTALEQAGTSLEHVVRTRVYLTDAGRLRRLSRARTARCSATSAPRTRPCVAAPLSTRAGRSRSRWRRCLPMTAASRRSRPRSRARSARSRAGSVLDHTFGKGDPYTLGVEEEYQLLDGETFDLVQHIDTVLAAVTGPRARGADQRRADAVGARDRDAGLPQRRPTSMRELHDAPRATSPAIAHEQGMRVGSAGHAPVQPLRAPADHRDGPLPRTSSTSSSTSRAAS